MGKIRILSEEIISKIAAGEVIERPASVVKELVENSIDACATEIVISLQRGGKSLITIRDNGTGIEKDDLRFLFQRHSTSKIKKFEDLFNIKSLGFRGEALYSISSISEIFLRSKTDEDQTGWEIHAKNQKKTEPKPVQMQKGTEIEVHNIFFNVPARRKFLKSDIVEFRKILDIFIPYPILYPPISFTLSHNKKIIFDLPSEKTAKNRISRIFNVQQENLLEIEWRLFDNSISIKAVLGNINIQRPRKDMQFIFINNRPVRHNGLSFTINNFYRNLMPPETYPLFVFFLTLKNEDVDINVHPTKSQVKIRNENEVLNVVRTILEKNFADNMQPKMITLQEDKKSVSIQVSEKTETYQKSSSQELIFEKAFEQEESEPPDFKDLFLQAKFVAIVLETYLIFGSADCLFFVDQHAAHERIIFEKLLSQARKGKIKAEQLLIPLSLPLSTQEMLAWESGGKIRLEEIGFQTTQWDKQTIAIHSCPESIVNPELAVRNILSEGNVDFDVETLLKKACRGSTMAGEQLSSEEAENLKITLMSCEQPLTCPHGRPTIIKISRKFIEKQFLR